MVIDKSYRDTRRCSLEIDRHLSICTIAAIAVNSSMLHEMAMCSYLAVIDKLNQARKGSKIHSRSHT